MTKIRHAALAACALTFVGMVGAAAAHADLRVVQKTTIQNPQLTAMVQSMSPAQRAQMAQTGGLFSGGPVTLVISTHGGEARVDFGKQTTLFNAATRRVTTLDRAAHTYTTSAFAPQAGAPVQATVRDTGQSKMIDGHRARRYTVALSGPQLEGGQLTGDVWSAPDLPPLPTALFASGPAAALQGLFHSIKGLPLRINVLVTGTPIGTTAVQSSALSVSVKPLSPSVFRIPAGYRLLVPPRGQP